MHGNIVDIVKNKEWNKSIYPGKKKRSMIPHKAYLKRN